MFREIGVGLNPVKTELNQDKVKGFIDRVSSAENFDDVKWILGEPVVNFSQSVVDEIIKANVNFAGKSGLQSMIVRTLGGDSCDWCKEMAGTYSYPDTPHDVFRRHDRCRCTVVSYIGKTKQDVWTKVKEEIK